MTITIEQARSNIEYIVTNYMPNYMQISASALTYEFELLDVLINYGHSIEYSYQQVLGKLIYSAGFYENAFPSYTWAPEPVYDFTAFANSSIPSDEVVAFFYPDASDQERATLIANMEAGNLTNTDFLIGYSSSVQEVAAPSSADIAAEASSITGTNITIEPIDEPEPEPEPEPIVLPLANLSFDGVNQAQLDFLVSLYISAFNRAPEYEGLSFWADALGREIGNGAAESDAILKIGQSMYAAGERNGEGGTNLPNEDYVVFAYQNSLGREPDQGGYDFWVNALNTGALNRGDFLTIFLDAALGAAVDGDYLKARLAVAEFAAQEHVSGPDAPGIDLLAIIDGVGDDASALSAITSIQETYGELHYGSVGIDTVSLQGASDDYSISLNGSLVTVSQGANKTAYAGVERLAFDNEIIAFDIDGNAGQAYRLYEAAFDRKPDAIGLGFWIENLDQGTSLMSVAQGFIKSEEFTQLYGNAPSNQEFVSKLYENILGRAPEQAGFDFWVESLENGATHTQVLVGFSESQENQIGVIGDIQAGIEYLSFA